MTRVLVTDAGRGSGMAVVRSLARRGDVVVAADVSRTSPAFVSRYVSARVLYPAPARDAQASIDVLARAAAEHRVDLVVPVGEDGVVLLSSARERFRDVAALAIPDDAALAAVRDKSATVELARRVGVPAPQTVLVETVAEAERAAAGFSWPIVLKPQASRALKPGRNVEPFGVAYASDPRTLVDRMRSFEGRCAVLLQEYWKGEGHGVGVVMDRGRTVLAFQHRRLREVPYTGGPSSFRESVALDPELLAFSERLLSALDWTGAAMVEFKAGPRGVTLMEVNGRLWGSLALAVKSGVDVPAHLVDVFVPRNPTTPAPPQLTYETGVRSRDLGLELNWIASVLGGSPRYGFLDVPRRRDAIAALVRLLDPRDGYDVMSIRDPLPGVAELVALAGKLRPEAVRSRRRRQRTTGR